MKTFDDRLQEVGGFGPGFNVVRIILASSVVVWHGISIVDGNPETGRDSMGWPLFHYMVPMFFLLSGYLVTGSALRLPLRQYLINRALRIVPALAVVSVLAALVIGPLFTSLPLAQYFQGHDFWTYFFNVFGSVHYHLPGVFLANPLPGVVNGSLWTVPFEIGCYILMAVLVLAGLIRSALTSAIIALVWLAAAAVIRANDWHSGVLIIDKLLRYVVVSGAEIIPFFFAGAAFYLARARIPFNRRIAMAVVCLLVAEAVFLDGNLYWNNPLFDLVMLAPLAYLVVYAGLQPLPELPIFRHGDYSYGIYLFHFPILQMLQQNLKITEVWQILLLGFPIVVGFAALSWQFVEKPVLSLRKRFSVVGSRIARDG
jgi:peptidoglycan/LPS O-acetylase OafA/YrhL